MTSTALLRSTAAIAEGEATKIRAASEVFFKELAAVRLQAKKEIDALSVLISQAQNARLRIQSFHRGIDAHGANLMAIADYVMSRYELAESEVFSRRRNKRISFIRHVVFWLAKSCTAASYPTIGRAYNRDHTSILHGFQAIERRIANDPAFRAELDQMRAHLAVALRKDKTDGQ